MTNFSKYICLFIVLLTACQPNTTPATQSLIEAPDHIILAAADLPYFQPDPIYFPQDTTIEPYTERPFDEALLEGELVLINGCVGVANGTASTPVIWPPEYTMTVDEFDVTIHDVATGELVARLGDRITVGGGTQNSVERLRQAREMLPFPCFELHYWDSQFFFATPTLTVTEAVSNRPCIGPTVSWTPFIYLNDIMYVGYRNGPEIDKSLLGEKVAQVDFMVNCHADVDYERSSGDAAFLPIGTPIYALKNYATTFRLAAMQDGHLMLFEVQDNPHVQTGEDLLDIRGKVVEITVHHMDGLQRQIGRINNLMEVQQLVALVLDAPINPQLAQKGSLAPRYRVRFHMNDGLTVERIYYPLSGELGHGILVPDEFMVIMDGLIEK